MDRNFTGNFFICQGLTLSVFTCRITLLGSKQTMSISETNQQFICGAFNSSPCQYEDVVLYYQETANLSCTSSICGNFSEKIIFKERDI